MIIFKVGNYLINPKWCNGSTGDSKSLSLGSNPSLGTMATIFKYNDVIYQCVSLEKKLKRLRINKEDIDILYDGDANSLEKKYLELTAVNKNTDADDNRNELYYFLNKDTGYSITSIYPQCKDNNYERCSKETLERLWNKNGKI